MDLERTSKRKPPGSSSVVDEELAEKARAMKQNFEVSQHMLNIMSEIERSKEVFHTIVVRKIEKDLPQIKMLEELKDRQRYLEAVIKDCIGRFETLRKIFSNQRKDNYIEEVLMNLVTAESLEDIEKQLRKREATKDDQREAAIKSYDLLRHDISNRHTMLDAYQVLEKLIDESKEKIIQHKMDKIECALRLRSHQTEITEQMKSSETLADMASPAHFPRSPPMTQRVMISGRPREMKNLLKLDLDSQRKVNNGMQVMMDMTSINKARQNQLMEPFKTACDRIKHEQDNLESLKKKKSKLRSKLIDVFAFLLRNPDFIL